MKIFNFIFTILIIILIISCAKQSTPMGGPKDEDPPILLSVTPTNEATNIKPKSIELVFNEYVKLENANKQIIITPRINKDEMIVTALKNEVTIKLNQELEDSTTYVFNFQKSIKDITESNPAENLKLVFSTGPTIDSLIFSGQVSYLFPSKEKLMQDVLVGLYPVGDTTDVLTAPPYYIGQADTIGRFEITNIKAGSYRAYAWHDVNNSLKAEDKTEPYGFLIDTLNMEHNISGAQFYLAKANLTPLKILRSSASGSNYDVVLSKAPTDITVNHPEYKEKIFYRIKDKSLRFYRNEPLADSTAISLSLKDSVGFKLDTVLYAKFEKSDRKKENLETSIKSGVNFINTIRAEFEFNKPIKSINFDSLLVKYDTASVIPIQKEWVYFNDSTTFTKLSIDINIPDSISKETFVVFAADSTFYDVEGMFNEKKLEGSFRKLKKEVLADALKVKINSEEYPFIFQLLNKSGVFIKEEYLASKNEFSFINLEANTYQIRVILDENGNGKWDTSNLLENRQPEMVYYFTNPDNADSRDILLKAGWELEITIDPRPKPGINSGATSENKAENNPSDEKKEDQSENLL